MKYLVTSAEVHDSQMLGELLDKRKDKTLFVDSAYKGEEIECCLGPRIENHICEKGYRNKPLTDEQKMLNKKISSVRVRVEHIFGFMTNPIKGMPIHCIEIERAKFAIGMMNLVYNMSRYRYLVSAHAYGQSVFFPR